MTLGLKNTPTTETFSTDSGDVTVWKHVDLTFGTFRSRCDLCVVREKVSTLRVDPDLDTPRTRPAKSQ